MTVTASLDSSGNPVLTIVTNYSETPQLVSCLNVAQNKLGKTIEGEVAKTLLPMAAQNTLNFVNSLLTNISAALGAV